MRPNGIHFDIKFNEGLFGGFPTAEKALDFLRTHPGEYTDIRLVKVYHYHGSTNSVDVPFTL